MQDSETWSHWRRNFTQIGTNFETGHANYWCLILVCFPLVCIAGNSLVVLAVICEKSLRNSTNFLLVSLAVADLMVGSLVMPFSIYLLVNNLKWYLPQGLCTLFCVVDVSASTASILNLMAISMDRFFAVVRHTEYKTAVHRHRIYLIIILSWVCSISIGLPLGMGLNPQDVLGQHHCGVVSPTYMLYGSIFAFYCPCIVMCVMYGIVFYRLRLRLRAIRLQELAAKEMVQFGDRISAIMCSAYGRRETAASIWAMPFLQTIQNTIHDDDSLSSDEIDELTTILNNLESDRRVHKYSAMQQQNSRQNKGHKTSSWHGSKMSLLRRSMNSVRRRSLTQAKQRIIDLKHRALTALMKVKSKQGMAIRKEARATKLVAIVLLVFLLCYLPFFSLNLAKVIKLLNDSWTDDLEILFTVFTWLGYLNSCLNPIIYTSINRKFRTTFRRLLLRQTTESRMVAVRKRVQVIKKNAQKTANCEPEERLDPLAKPIEYRKCSPEDLGGPLVEIEQTLLTRNQFGKVYQALPDHKEESKEWDENGVQS